MFRLKSLLADGWTRVRAVEFLAATEAECKSNCFDKEFLEWSHRHGFLAMTASNLNLNEGNFSLYLSDYDFLKMWPLNDWGRIWVNDKLTLKLMLEGTEFSSIMPQYYYYSSSRGLFALSDCRQKEATLDQFIRKLKEMGTFACKPCNGTLSDGFHKMTYSKQKESEILSFVYSHPNYLYTEYIVPSDEFRKFSWGGQIHTLRIVTLNEHGYDPIIIGGYLRLPVNNGNDGNYVKVLDSETFNLNVGVDFETGCYCEAYKTYFNHRESISFHPDTGAEIQGRIENFSDLKDSVLGIAKKFCTLEYLGFDIGVTTKGFKCMEINTLPGITYMQLFKPMLADSRLKRYFSRKIESINSLDEQHKKLRNSIVR